VDNDCKRLLPERSELNGLRRSVIFDKLQAERLGQHWPAGIGAGLPSGHDRKIMLHMEKPQFEIGWIGEKSVLHALNDGQHPPDGIGAREPSGQILMSIVQNILAQLGLNGKIAP